MKSLLLVALVVLAWPLTARAERHAQGSNVVHSRRAAVIAHRVVPPFRGVHVYEGRGRR